MQMKAFYSTIISCYFVGLPCCYLFAFHYDMETPGLWLSSLIAFAVGNVVCAIFAIRADWHDVSQKAIERMEESKRKLLEK